MSIRRILDNSATYASNIMCLYRDQQRLRDSSNLIASLLVLASLAGLAFGSAYAQSSEKVPRILLENMARSQYSILCGSPEFTSCMGFTGAACTDLSEAAIKQCLLPLPEAINLEELDNDAVESCPKKVFADAGFTEEKAGLCFDEAIKPKQ